MATTIKVENTATELARLREQALRDEIEKKHGKSPEQLYEEREKRIRDAIELKEPDRVPVIVGGTYFAAKYGGLDCASAHYDAVGWKTAYKKMLLDFEPDAFGTAATDYPGLALEALDTTHIKWPGHGLPNNLGFQVVQEEYMKDDEYDLFLSDPSDFILRLYLPRVFKSLAPLSKLPPLRTVHAKSFSSLTPLFASDEFLQAAKAVHKAGREQIKWREAVGNFEEELAALGFPADGTAGKGAGGPPFDVVANYFRGLRIMLDIHRRPDKLLAACEKILEWNVARATPPDPAWMGNPKRTGAAIHRGSDEFLSKKQWETFYWPTLKRAILKSIDLGYVFILFCEGRCESRLESLLEIPKGKMVCRFSYTDMKKAKEILGNHFCIMGNVPPALLQVGSAQEVQDYCKDLIKVCGKGGGFILRAATDAMEDLNPANVKAMVESAKKFGVY